MFTLKALKQRLSKKSDSSTLAQPQRPQTIPCLEILEDRTMPSASALPTQAFVYEASPPAAPSLQAVHSVVASAMDQVDHFLATIQQEMIGEYRLISQVIAQVMASFEQQMAPSSASFRTSRIHRATPRYRHRAAAVERVTALAAVPAAVP